MFLVRRILISAKRYFFAAGGALFGFSVGVFTSSGRHLILKICQHFGYAGRFIEPQLPCRGLGSVLDQQRPILLLEPAERNGNVTVIELVVLCHLARRTSPRQIFEIGTFDGRTILNLAANTPESTACFTLDLPAEDEGRTTLELASDDLRFIRKEKIGERFLSTDYRRRIHQLRGDSASIDLRQHEGNMEFIFIDGSHSYPYVKNDTELAFKLLSPSGGTIVWHDYDSSWPGVTAALNGYYKGDARFRSAFHIEGTSLVVLETHRA